MLFGGLLFGQRSTYNHCSGAVFAPVEGMFSLSYLGDKKSNQIWVVFIAPKSGEVELEITAISSSLTVSKGVVIRSNVEICDLTDRKNQTIDSVSFELRGSEKLIFHVEKNQFASLCLTTNSGIKDDVIFNCKFKADNTQEEEDRKSVV